MGTVTTDKDGKAQIADLPLGTYKVVEKTAPEGFVLNEEAQTVTFSYKDQKTPVIEQTAAFENDRQKRQCTAETFGSDTVRMIFNMKIDGYSAKNIAARLNEMGVLIPAEYKRACGFNYSSGFMAGKKPKWDVSSVLRILKNELYTGTMVQGKTRKINYKVNVRQKIEPENWIRVEGTHERIGREEKKNAVE